MAQFTIQCLRDYHQFESLREEWEAFMVGQFPENYCRSHAWLSAWWKTYHSGNPALVYLERAAEDGRILSAAPLMTRRENFGGFPVQMLRALGSGLGSDDFLIGSESRGGLQSILEDVATRQAWHVGTFGRIRSAASRDAIASHLGKAECKETDDHLVTLPDSYAAYLKSRSSKFRNNLAHATKRLEAEGEITVEIFAGPGVERALDLCGVIARESWQFKEGKSHFNQNGAGSFYENLTREKRWAGGEEFMVLLCGKRPAAYIFGCRRGSTYYLVDTAYHPDYRHVSVGRVLLSRLIERLIAMGGVRHFDMEGTGEYKEYYATDRRPVHFFTLYRQSLYPKWIKALRGSSFYDKLRQKNRER